MVSLWASDNEDKGRACLRFLNMRFLAELNLSGQVRRKVGSGSGADAATGLLYVDIVVNGVWGIRSGVGVARIEAWTRFRDRTRWPGTEDYYRSGSVVQCGQSLKRTSWRVNNVN